MKLFFTDSEFDAQFQRSAIKLASHSVDLGELFALARKIEEGNRQSWYESWYTAAQEVLELANEQAAAGNPVDACDAFLRASEYFRSSYFFQRSDITDPVMLDAWNRCRISFATAAELMPHPCEPVPVPYDDIELTGYFATPDSSGTPRPTILFPCGYDSPLEESYSLMGAEAVRRGYNALMFTGPGQAEVLYEYKIGFRHDFEHVVNQVVDYAITRPDVDETKIVLIGRSFGGYLAPRAASGEHRLAALIADPGQINLGAGMRERLPNAWLELFDARDPKFDELFVNHMMGTPNARENWAWRFTAHQVETPTEYVAAMTEFVVPADQIQCPSFISQGEGDFAGQAARDLFDAINAPKKFTQFTEEEGSGGHCEGMGITRFQAAAFGWLQGILYESGAQAEESTYTRG